MRGYHKYEASGILMMFSNMNEDINLLVKLPDRFDANIKIDGFEI